MVANSQARLPRHQPRLPRPQPCQPGSSGQLRYRIREATFLSTQEYLRSGWASCAYSLAHDDADPIPNGSSNDIHSGIRVYRLVEVVDCICQVIFCAALAIWSPLCSTITSCYQSDSLYTVMLLQYHGQQKTPGIYNLGPRLQRN